MNIPPMNILFITAHKYLPQMYGGLQTSTDELCHSLKACGHTVSILAGLMPGGLFGLTSRIKMKLNKLICGHPVTMDNVLGYRVWRSWFPAQEVAYVASLEKPDLIVVLAIEPILMGLAALPTGIPVMMQLMDVEFKDHGGDFTKLGNIACMSNSHFTAKKYKDAYGLDSTVIYPFIAPEKYKTNTTRENVTFINPVAEKGLAVALETARLCPDIPFTFIEGWPLAPHQREPLMAALGSLPNVTFLPPQGDMRNVYGKCKILFAPSQWEEAYGRVATEAQMSAIPVVGSNRAGLAEAIGPGGVMLAYDAPAQDWADAIKKLWNDQIYYDQISQAALAYASRPEMGYDYLLTAMEQSFKAAANQ